MGGTGVSVGVKVPIGDTGVLVCVPVGGTGVSVGVLVGVSVGVFGDVGADVTVDVGVGAVGSHKVGASALDILVLYIPPVLKNGLPKGASKFHPPQISKLVPVHTAVCALRQ